FVPASILVFELRRPRSSTPFPYTTPFRSRIGDPAENRLRERGYELEVFQGPEAPPKKLIVDKVKSGIDGLITTLRDPIDAALHRSEEHTSELQSRRDLVCRLLLEKKKNDQ